MRPIRRILVGVKHPSRDAQPAVIKAAQIAAGSGATLELLHVIAMTPDTAALTVANLGPDFAAFQRDTENTQREALEKVAAQVKQYAVQTEISVIWDYPVHEAIIRRALASDTDLIVAGQHEEKRVAPWLLSYIDWELLRLSPQPVLLIKSQQPYREPVILAALDPSHAHAKPAHVDEAILDVAVEVQKALQGVLHALHAYESMPVVVNRARLRDPAEADRVIREATERAYDEFAALVDKAGLTTVEKHFLTGSAVDVIPDVARRLNSAIVVMGAVSRSGLRRLFIGNTAEKVLSQLSCDVLVVKPAGFTTSVPRAVQPGM